MISPDGPLAGKVAIVFGGSRGIGAACCLRLAAAGAAIALVYLERSAAAQKVAGEVRALGVDALTLQADLSDSQALFAAIEAAALHFGTIDISIGVAGVTVVGALDDYTVDDVDRAFALNVRAPFLIAQRVASKMRDNGRIIMIGSIVASRMPGEGGTLYAASKSALHGMTRGLARDLGDRSITVNLVQPGPTDTERNPTDGPNAEANRGPMAIKRHGSADEIASLVCWLASPDAGFVTGSIYNIDGGWAA